MRLKIALSLVGIMALLIFHLVILFVCGQHWSYTHPAQWGTPGWWYWSPLTQAPLWTLGIGLVVTLLHRRGRRWRIWRLVVPLAFLSTAVTIATAYLL